MSDEETMKGAEQRARAALTADPTLDYGTRILELVHC